MSTWPDLHSQELACHCRKAKCPKHGMQAEMIAPLRYLRERMGRPLPLSKAYTCNPLADDPTHNTGMAVDIAISGMEARRLIEIAIDIGFRGIGIKLHGPRSGQFIHLDNLMGMASDGGVERFARPRIWSIP